jgi:hypothetical protein
VGVGIDKRNHRVYTSEQYPGRLQMFRYVTDAEAAAEKSKHEDDLKQAAERRQKAASAPAKADTPAGQKPEAADPKDTSQTAPPKQP